MRRASRCCPAGIGLVLMVVLLTGCRHAVRVDPAGKGDPWETTTARGLAAAALQHLDGADPPVEVVDGDYPAARIVVGDDDLTSIWVSVAPLTGPSACGGGSGLRVIECSVDPFRELSVNPGQVTSGAPMLAGRYADARRGSVLVEVVGEDTDDNRDLVRALVRDHLIGLSTTREANEAGAELSDVDELQVELRLSEG